MPADLVKAAQSCRTRCDPTGHPVVIQAMGLSSGQPGYGTIQWSARLWDYPVVSQAMGLSSGSARLWDYPVGQPGYGTIQAMEWVAIPFSRGSSQPRD